MYFADDLASQSLDQYKKLVVPTNHLAGTSKSNLTAAKLQHRNHLTKKTTATCT